jgi:molecular chaperone GrpE
MSKQNRIVTPSDEEVETYGAAGDNVNDEKTHPDSEASGDAGRREAEDWRDKFLRAKAELSNYQKRSEKDKSDAMRYAHAELARALLPIIDDLDRLIKSASDAGGAKDALVQGVRLTQENFLKVLQQFHVQPIEAQGQPFDPSVHEAMMQQPSEKHGETAIVLQEVGRGFTLHDRVLRPAKVIVSKSMAVSPEGQ